MSEPKFIEDLFAKRSGVIKPGLERTNASWERLGFPAKNIPTIIVGGTNGKGSTSSFIAMMLRALGFKVGHFTSPHLVEFRERIAVGGEPISNTDLESAFNRVRDCVSGREDSFSTQSDGLIDKCDLWDSLTFFEINTLLALQVFEDCAVDVCVLEVGLGGRLDCTNITSPLVSVITSIGLDHKEWLGDTLEKILEEKAGIIRRGKSCVFGGSRLASESCTNRMSELAGAEALTLHIYEKDFFADSKVVRLKSRGRSYEFKFPKGFKSKPRYFRDNWAMAIRAVVSFFEECLSAKKLLPTLVHPSGDWTDLVHKLNQFSEQMDCYGSLWPLSLRGRFDRIKVQKDGREQILILDVCHNPHGAKALASGLDELGVKRLPLLITVLADKDVAGIWEGLNGRISEVIAFKISSERTWLHPGPVPSGMFESFHTAWVEAMQREAFKASPEWLICGSVAGIGAVLEYFKQESWDVTHI